MLRSVVNRAGLGAALFQGCGVKIWGRHSSPIRGDQHSTRNLDTHHLALDISAVNRVSAMENTRLGDLHGATRRPRRCCCPMAMHVKSKSWSLWHESSKASNLGTCSSREKGCFIAGYGSSEYYTTNLSTTVFQPGQPIFPTSKVCLDSPNFQDIAKGCDASIFPSHLTTIFTTWPHPCSSRTQPSSAQYPHAPQH